MGNNESAVRTIIENWARAVRERNMDGILAHHTDDIVMYDVPQPFESCGIEAYKKTWETFYDWAEDSGVFDITELHIVAGEDVAFAYAAMKCSGYDDTGNPEPLKFRLTTGLIKVNGQWMIKHEHHSIPGE
jgi:ketosteroid isomerase-like protein